MRRDQFNYHLPPELIAQQPLAVRSASRLLAVDGASGERRDLAFRDLPALLKRGDLLVFNDTRVINARLRARKPSGGRVELLLERVLDDHRAMFQARASKALREGGRLVLEGGASARVLGRREDLFELQFAEPVLAYLARHGELPLPPYIEREARPDDAQRYQTVFARVDGAVAAPTAGLHFDETTLAELETRGVLRAHVTLHVGAGTFQPVRVDELSEHRMHAEWLEVGAGTCERIASVRSAGGRVVAVGTTVVRALESAYYDGAVRPFSGDTRLFIQPGYRFRAVDALLTNFHLPESTLLMLVCAFAGMGTVLDAYQHAVRERYRFFSYGDAMFLTPTPEALSVNQPPAGEP